ncbi:MAG TPA: chorismate synthase [Candidatus Avidesulfovibrio excrementigallinarum]|nr:chorismate synthase [Candidatus Avidesulfovibrio excrementigallinarum]
MNYHLFGESHGPAIGVVLEDVPAGIELDMAFVAAQMARRAPGGSLLATARREADAVEIVSGVFEGRTCGTPLCAIIRNTDMRSRDYEATRWLARPGHADWTGHLRYAGCNDPRGGGHFSGRLTAPLVFAGAVARLALRGHGIEIAAHIRELAGLTDSPVDYANPDLAALRALPQKDLAVLDDAAGEAMRERIVQARACGDSVGGVIECLVCGMPAGLGGPDFDDSVESLWARYLLAIPAVKGLEFGAGFRLAAMRGSEANDPFYRDSEGRIRTRTNNNGGINGGITNGMPLVCAVAIKPTPSIALEQETVDMRTGESARLRVGGRHDPCILPRAVPVVEAATALTMQSLLACGARS